MRTALGIVAGIIVALLVQSGADFLAGQLYPSSVTDMWDRRQVSEAFAARPTPALLISIAGFLLGALIGGGAGKAIAGRPAAAWVPGLILAAMAGLIGANFPLPAWASAGMVIAALIGGLIANHLVNSRQAAAAESTEPTEV